MGHLVSGPRRRRRNHCASEGTGQGHFKGEFDQKTQVSLTHDLIRYMTGQTYMIPRPVANRGYEVWWPAVANHGINERWAQNNARPTEEAISWWIDQTKAPFA